MFGWNGLASILVAMAMAAANAGCGGGDCVSLCQEGQDGNCTSIDGDCDSFCGALDSVEEPSDCAAEREEYESCLGDTSDVCDASCGASENALTQCVASYCLQNSDSEDCQTLVKSF